MFIFDIIGSVEKFVVKKVVKSRIQKIDLRELTGVIKQVGMMYSDLFATMGAGVDAMEKTLHENAEEVASVVADLAGPSKRAYNKGVEFLRAMKELADAYEEQPDVEFVMDKLSTNCGDAITDHIEKSSESRIKAMAEMGKSFLGTFIKNLDIPEEILEQSKDDLVNAGILNGEDDDKKVPKKKMRTAKKKIVKK